MNEFLLILSLPLTFGAVLIFYRFLGRAGLYAFCAIATLLANIEVVLLVDAFGMEQTLGNVMFAATCLITDILSENEGKVAARRGVLVGLATSLSMLVFTQFWLLFTPSAADTAMPAIRAIFSRSPRILLGGFLGYLVAQVTDVWLYHKFWDYSLRRTGDGRRMLWLRNNASTLISQVLNTVIFTLVAFAGTYPPDTILSIMLSTYLIYIFTSLADTPALYLARHFKEKGKIPTET